MMITKIQQTIWKLILCWISRSNQIARNRGATCMHVAAQTGNVDWMMMLLKRRNKLQYAMDVNAKTTLGSSPLHLAVCARQFTIIQMLVSQKDVNVNALDAMQRTALHHVFLSPLHQTSERIALLLMNHGANLNIPDSSKQTVLHLAILSKCSESLLERVIEGNNSLNAQDRNGNTALHYAVESKDLNKVNMLLKQGAKIHLKNVYKETPLDLAKQIENESMIHEIQSRIGSSQDGYSLFEKLKFL